MTLLTEQDKKNLGLFVKTFRVSLVFVARVDLQEKEALKVEWDCRVRKETKDLKDNLCVYIIQRLCSSLLYMDQPCNLFGSVHFLICHLFFSHRVTQGNKAFQEFWEILGQGCVQHRHYTFHSLTHFWQLAA